MKWGELNPTDTKVVPLPDPTPEKLETPEFNALWELMKDWDIEVSSGDGYTHTQGNHVRAILDALSSIPKEREQLKPSATDGPRTRLELLTEKLEMMEMVLRKVAHFCRCRGYNDREVTPDRNSLEARFNDDVGDALIKLKE